MFHLKCIGKQLDAVSFYLARIHYLVTFTAVASFELKIYLPPNDIDLHNKFSNSLIIHIVISLPERPIKDKEEGLYYSVSSIKLIKISWGHYLH